MCLWFFTIYDTISSAVSAANEIFIDSSNKPL